MLTGKAKEQFETWLQKELNEDRVLWEVCNIHGFSDLSESMQWGCYQDWADSLGYSLESVKIADQHRVVIFDRDIRTHKHIDWHSTRQEARNAAIKKLNELINEG